MSGPRLTVSILALAILLVCPAAARAQSAMAGVVKDATGAVIPGVSVEAASPVLIEKARYALTDAEGVFRIEGLFPGTYTVTFTLAGFNTVKRDGLELPGNFTATVNAELRIGALEETVTVSGASPVVDVQSTASAQVIGRDLLDAIPTGRTAQTAAALVVGVAMASPDVGGSGAQKFTTMTTHGMNSAQTTVLLDGIQLNGLDADGSTQSYTNTQHYEEIVIQTSGAGADVGAGGVRQSLIPRKGGNQFHGSSALQVADGDWQADAVSPELRARGLTIGTTTKLTSNMEVGTGGKFIQDKLWWFAAARKQVANEGVADTFYPDGSQGVNEQYVRNLGLRLTYQVDRRNQVSVFYDRIWKYLSSQMDAGYDPVTAGLRTYPSANYGQGQFKWTSTISSRFLVEVGANQYQAIQSIGYQPGVQKPYGTPEWFAGATRRDLALGTVTGAYPIQRSTQAPTRRFLSASASYITGSHSVKIGVQDTWGYEWFAAYKNADLEQNYTNGVPTSVYAFNSPVAWNNAVDANWALYAQDTWTLKRLSLNFGVRWEYFKASVPEKESTPGRFGPTQPRTFGPEVFPIWKDTAPRFGAVYDLRGDAKTALKVSVNKYVRQLTDGLTNAYNPIRLQQATLAWTDLNGDDVAQGERGCTFGSPGCEINLGQLPANFAAIVPGCTVLYTPGSIPCGNAQLDAARTREYSWQYGVGVQHEVLPRVSASINWFHTRFYNLPLTYNSAQTAADYSPVPVVSPMDGRIVTVYNVSAAAQTRVLNLESNATDRQRWNNAIEIGFGARLPGGATLFGGVASDLTIEVSCDDPVNPNNQIYCDERQSHKPWLNQIKIAGSVPLPWGIQLGAALQNYNRYLSTGGAVWLVTRTTRYASDCLGPCVPNGLVNPTLAVAQISVPLEPRSLRLSDRINQLDINIGKWITVRNNLRVQPELAIFNAFNNLAVFGARSLNFGTSSYLQPATTLPPRTIRLGAQIKW
jgi:hypothetical protein